jgi:HK97 family phage major capsid protein/HK97 family phage prohead protease
METSKELRSASYELREEGDQKWVHGIAATYEQYDMGPFIERIERTAFPDMAKQDVRALKNHDANQVLARSKYGKGTLQLQLTERGLEYSFPLPDTTLGKDVKQDLALGNIDQSSWRFYIEEDNWDFSGEKAIRTITKVSKVEDVSLVTYPANADTSVALRSMEEAKAEFEKAKQIEQTKMEENKKTDALVEERANPKFVEQSTVGSKISKDELRSLKGFNIITLANQIISGRLEGLYAELNQEGINERNQFNGEVKRNPGAFHLPEMMQTRHRQELQMRANSVTGGTAGDEGGNLVATEFGRWTNLLYPDTPILNLCAKLDNLRGDQEFPSEETGVSLNWGTETATASLQKPTYDTQISKPERAWIATGYTNRLLAQEHSNGVQQRLFNKMNNAFNQGMEAALVAGSGTSNQPTGILTALSGSALTIGALTHDHMIDFELALADADALVDGCAYVTSQKARASMKTIKVDAGSGIFLANGNLTNTFSSNGYRVFGTSSMPQYSTGTKESMIFGNFNDVSLNMWGSPVIMVNPYTQMKSSITELYIERQMNVTIHRTDSFAIAKDITV